MGKSNTCHLQLWIRENWKFMPSICGTITIPKWQCFDSRRKQKWSIRKLHKRELFEQKECESIVPLHAVDQNAHVQIIWKIWSWLFFFETKQKFPWWLTLCQLTEPSHLCIETKSKASWVRLSATSAHMMLSFLDGSLCHLVVEHNVGTKVGAWPGAEVGACVAPKWGWQKHAFPTYPIMWQAIITNACKAVGDSG